MQFSSSIGPRELVRVGILEMQGLLLGSYFIAPRVLLSVSILHCWQFGPHNNTRQTSLRVPVFGGRGAGRRTSSFSKKNNISFLPRSIYCSGVLRSTSYNPTKLLVLRGTAVVCMCSPYVFAVQYVLAVQYVCVRSMRSQYSMCSQHSSVCSHYSMCSLYVGWRGEGVEPKACVVC